MTDAISRRELFRRTLFGAGSAAAAISAFGLPANHPSESGEQIKSGVFAFLQKCARKDGGYAPSPDPNYHGNSDTAESDLAAVAYAAILHANFGQTLPNHERSIKFIQSHQQPDGVFVNHEGKLNPKEDLAILYNTTQGVVSLRALGAKPKYDPSHVMDRFFKNGAFKKLQWYTMSFYPLFYAALGVHFPDAQREAIESWLKSHQAADGYLGNLVASTFHLVHFFRLIGQTPPRSSQIIERVMHDQRPDGGWLLNPPSWDVHSCFDAVFILRQLGHNAPRVRRSINRAADWALSCRTPDGGFGHFPGWHSDVDAVYFNFGTLIQAGRVPGAKMDLPDGNILGWGQAMKPGKIYPYP